MTRASDPELLANLDHPLRFDMVNELHARPSARLTAPSRVVYLAFKEPRDAANRDRASDLAHLADLAQRHGAPVPQQGIGHYTAQMGRHELRWEGHTEFVSYASFTPGRAARPFDPSQAELFAADWQARAPGKRLAAILINIDFMPATGDELESKLNDWFVKDGLTVVDVLEGSAVVATDFRIDPAGWMRFAVFVTPDMGPGRLGRLVQRLTELETYRAMAMLGLRRARTLTANLNALDTRMTALVEGLTDDTRPADAVLRDLLKVSAQLESEATQMSFRFGATRAYEAIVHDRIAALRESRYRGRQTMTEFMTRRFEPAMRTVHSAEARLTAMVDRAARAGELLSTRVEVERSEQNQALLSRMDRRADLQLRLQHTVEGLSVVAISYYAVGLLSYALSPVAHTLDVDKTLLLAALTPLVVLGVWYAMRRVRARLHDTSADDGHSGH